MKLDCVNEDIDDGCDSTSKKDLQENSRNGEQPKPAYLKNFD